MIYRGTGFLAVVGFGSTPTPFSPKAEKEIQLAAGREGEEVGEEPNHTTQKKAWSSINLSILSGEEDYFRSSVTENNAFSTVSANRHSNSTTFYCIFF
jgi:hypothetical protein